MSTIVCAAAIENTDHMSFCADRRRFQESARQQTHPQSIGNYESMREEMLLLGCTFALWLEMSIERLIPYLAQSIKQRREQLGMSHAELAEEAGFSAEYIEFIETGSTNFSMKTLSAVAKALNYAPSELIEAAEQLAEHDSQQAK